MAGFNDGFCAGTMGVEGVDFAAQQSILTPPWQHARARETHGAAAVDRNGVPISARLNTMANIHLTVSVSIFYARVASLLLVNADQFLASAALIVFMYVSGSLRNFGLHMAQQNLISWFW